jgi:hypothetical protein
MWIEGQDFPDDEAAKVAGVKYAGSMLNDQPDIVQPGRPFRVNVVDKSQRLVAAIVIRVERTDPSV